MATTPPYVVSTATTITCITVVTDAVAFPTKTDADTSGRVTSKYDEPEPSFTALSAATVVSYSEQS